MKNKTAQTIKLFIFYFFGSASRFFRHSHPNLSNWCIYCVLRCPGDDMNVVVVFLNAHSLYSARTFYESHARFNETDVRNRKRTCVLKMISHWSHLSPPGLRTTGDRRWLIISKYILRVVFVDWSTALNRKRNTKDFKVKKKSILFIFGDYTQR